MIIDCNWFLLLVVREVGFILKFYRKGAQLNKKKLCTRAIIRAAVTYDEIYAVRLQFLLFILKSWKKKRVERERENEFHIFWTGVQGGRLLFLFPSREQKKKRERKRK